MIRFDQWYLPDGETHLQGWMTKRNERVQGRLTYQYYKYAAAVKHCASKRTVVDVGAHVGLMSYWMAQDFKIVYAFEPVDAHRECFRENVKAENIILHPYALGEKRGSVSMYSPPTSSGGTFVQKVGAEPGGIPMHVLDDYEFQNVDFIKLDTEGHELFILRGAEQTLRRCMPTIMCEQKPGKAQQFGLGQTDALPFLQSLGYKVVDVMSGDYVLVADLKDAA